MNKKVFWSLAISPVVILPAFVIASCSDNSITSEPKSEAARFHFLNFKKEIYDQKFSHTTAESFQQAIQSKYTYDKKTNLGLENLNVKLEKGVFIIDFRIKLFYGTLEELNGFLDSEQPAKDSDPRERVQNTFRIDTNATDGNTP